MMDDERFAATAGFDALTFVRALKLMMLMSLYVAITVCILVLPVNATASSVDAQLARQNSPAYADCGSPPPEDVEDNLVSVRSPFTHLIVFMPACTAQHARLRAS
jgi:Late exocytosis, associated with Golgi transport